MISNIVFLDGLFMNQVLIQQVKLLDPNTDRETITDIWLEAGKIKAIAPQLTDLPENIDIIAGQDLILAPGLVDLYSHSGEPGYEERETLISLASAAIAGGFTQIAILPDTQPPLDNVNHVISLQQKANNIKEIIPHLEINFWGAITLNLDRETLTELGELANSGIIGFTDRISLSNLGLLRRVLEYLHPFGKPIALTAYDSKLKGNGVMREGAASIRFGLPGNPSFSETTAIAAILELVAATNTPIHLMKVSTARGVELIADAKARGLPVTASTTWMHLLLNSEAIASYDPNLRLEPPLGNENDLKALIQGVKEGIIEAIAIDHTPYTYEEKTLSFAEAPPGVIGLELALPILWQNFVATGEWSALQLWKALSYHPLLCLGKSPKPIQVGEIAELILFDPQKTWKVEAKTLKSQSLNTPWLGKELTGKVIRVF
jgi:dihydroorotase